MSVTIQLNLKNIVDRIEKKIDVMLIDIAKECIRYIKSIMREPKTGRIYIVPGTKQKYRASAPGETPAIRTGRLFQSISHTAPDHRGKIKSIEIGTNVKYAPFLERGTEKMKKRPAFARAFKDAESRKKIYDTIKYHFRRI